MNRSDLKRILGSAPMEEPVVEPLAIPADYRVLVVDDISTNCIVAKRILERIGVPYVDTATNGEAALALAAERPPNLVLTDLWMPGASGVDLEKSLHERQPNLPVVAITADNDRDERRFPEQTRFRCVVQKPLTVENLHKVLKDIL